VCHKGTIGGAALLCALAILGAPSSQGQIRTEWRRIGSPAVELDLASPATGPVDQVWFSADGSQLFARTLSGRIFATVDYENWNAVELAPQPPATVLASVSRLPDLNARVLAMAASPRRVYALGGNLFSSEDGGSSWTNLTQYKSSSVVGAGQHSLAVSPVDPEQLVLANDFGVWRSVDGGLSWSGLNRSLPNLAVRRIVATPSGASGARVQAQGMGSLELPPGGSIWFPDANPAPTPTDDARLMRQYSAMTGAQITAVGSGGTTVYAGANDGRIWVSLDSGATFRLSRDEVAGPVERIFVDGTEPRVALAALGGNGAHVLRTTSSGSIWDDLTANLPAAAAHGVTAERASGAVYVATDQGVFYATTDLENATFPTINWTNLTTTLPAAAAMDVRLDPAGVQLYIALDGYGVYATAAPHRLRNLRIVSAADFSTRAAAPGSLLSVMGGRVSAAHGGSLNYPVLSAADGQSQIQVPFEAVGPNVSLSLETNNGPVTLGLPVKPVSPAIFVGSDGAPMIYDADSGLPLDTRNTAHSNGRIQILATGLGKVRPEWPINMLTPANNPPVVVAGVKAYLDGAPLEVSQATLAPGYPSGFYLVEVQLPAINNLGTSALYLTADGQESNRVQIVIEP
jgi:uncharacterized protein (TIGR03437 family)